jgi:hypothetical protein
MTEEQTSARKRAKAAKPRSRTTASDADEATTEAPDAHTAATATMAAATPPATEAAEEAASPGRRSITIPLPNFNIPTPSLPRMPLPSQHAVVMTAYRVGDVVQKNAPSADQLLYYGGLGALAAFGAIEWPVAAAIGAGVWVARRNSGKREQEQSRATAPQAARL